MVVIRPEGQNMGAAHIETHLNLAVIIGEVARDATCMETDDGRTFTNFDLVCRTEEGRTVVPVTVEGNEAVSAGEVVAVAGHVSKRFFSTGRGMASRTDVRADKVVVIRRKDQITRFVAGVMKGLGSR